LTASEAAAAVVFIVRLDVLSRRASTGEPPPMPKSQPSQRRLLRQTVDWWEADRNRLFVIRAIAYLLLAGSIAGTIYSGITGVLPVWAATLYVFFAVQLVFMTFMYAIKHSSLEEVRRAVLEIRRGRLVQWEFERTMLAEFARFAACTSAGLDPTVPPPRTRRGRLIRSKPPVPAVVDKAQEVRELTRRALEARATPDPALTEPLQISFMAYSAETIIDLSREILAELDEQLGDDSRSLVTQAVAVRVLVRDTSDDHEWLVPLAENERDDEEYAADLRTRFRNVQRSALKEFEDGLKDIVPPRDVRFEVRGYRLEPLIKGIVFDGSEGMFGLYAIDELRDPDGWDYSGHAVDLCRVARGGEYFESVAFDFFSEWFEALWENDRYSHPLAHR
jgi:hypothetical protein